MEGNPHISFDLADTKRDNAPTAHYFIDFNVFNFVASLFFTHPHICVSERIGIPLFYRELGIHKIEMVEHFQNLKDDLKSGDSALGFMKMLNKINTRYALPVKDNIDFIRSIPDIIKDDSPPPLAELNDYIVAMAGGVYRYQPEEGLVFASKPRSKTKFALTSNLWSSSVKALSNLFFYLKHTAKPGQLLIIDEPETHLTPQNQIILARLLAACVNQGIKVLVTTHSDYLVKEFNNLIMLHNLPEQIRATFMSRKGSPYKPGEMLNPDRVKAYICQKGGVVACRLDQYGLEVTSMDEAIHSMNETANELVDMMEDANLGLVV
ncbi:MAG: ATP-binding protein [Magnetococcales bacterium]|nr:ATP-binding protein [Magnetococcales bacterium]